MKKLIELWERRVKHYEKLIDSSTNDYVIEGLDATADTFRTCIDELKRTLDANKEE